MPPYQKPFSGRRLKISQWVLFDAFCKSVNAPVVDLLIGVVALDDSAANCAWMCSSNGWRVDVFE